MTEALTNPVVVDFPLRGENWLAVTTPAERIPSHGVDALGQRYAYDFLKIDRRNGDYFHPAGAIKTLVAGVPTRECYAWGATIHAPFDGVVARVVDGISERSRIIPLREAFLALKNGLTFRPSRLPAILGNYVIMRSGDIFGAFVHLAPGSITVSEGQQLATGDAIGRVGHTGNSTSPHLHFQLMDSADPLVANGIPCAFRAYDVEKDGVWTRVDGGIPGRHERIRSVET